MDYEEAVARLEAPGNFGGKRGLGRIRRLLSLLGDPQERLRFVHVAGTNGKGTTCALLASVLKRAGYRTGLYQSPHVCDFRERIQVDGEMIPRDAFCGVAERVLAAAERMKAEGETAAAFERFTAAAMVWFAERDCDVVVLEVGLGGRFDATNVIPRSLVSVITSVSLDHTKILGNTVEQIAYEKCGIIREGGSVVCCPGEPPDALEVIRSVVSERRGTLTDASALGVRALDSGLSGTELAYGASRLRLPFLGLHQVKNAAAALAAIEILRGEGFTIQEAAVSGGFSEARLPARQEVLSLSPTVLLDGAHNPEGVGALADTVSRFLSGKETVAVGGMLADKDARSSAAKLKGLFSTVFTVAPQSERALGADEFAGILRETGLDAHPAESVGAALDAAFSLLKPDGALVVFGSLYLAGEARPLLVKRLGAQADAPCHRRAAGSSPLSEK